MPKKKRETIHTPSCTEQFTVTFKLYIQDEHIKQHCSNLARNFNNGATDGDPKIEDFSIKGKTATFSLNNSHSQRDVKSRVRSSMTSDTVLAYQVADNGQPA